MREVHPCRDRRAARRWGSDRVSPLGRGVDEGTEGARGGARGRAGAGPDGDAADVAGDAALIVAVAAGDRAALAALYDRYAGALLGLGIRVLRSRREAEDVVHDVFLEVWRRAHTYEPARASVRAWLMLMMRCRALDRRKSHGFALRAPLERDPRVAPASESPAVAVDRARVAAAVEALPEAQRAVLLLGYFEGLSSSEMAERLGLPLGTVKSRVAAAMRALRATLRVADGDLAGDDARGDADGAGRSGRGESEP